jgi:hypothetical protein
MNLRQLNHDTTNREVVNKQLLIIKPSIYFATNDVMYITATVNDKEYISCINLSNISEVFDVLVYDSINELLDSIHSNNPNIDARIDFVSTIVLAKGLKSSICLVTRNFINEVTSTSILRESNRKYNNIPQGRYNV